MERKLDLVTTQYPLALKIAFDVEADVFIIFFLFQLLKEGPILRFVVKLSPYDVQTSILLAGLPIIGWAEKWKNDILKDADVDYQYIKQGSDEKIEFYDYRMNSLGLYRCDKV